MPPRTITRKQRRCRQRRTTLRVASNAELRRLVARARAMPVVRRSMPWWDVSRVTDTAGLFQDWPEFNEDIRRWDMARVTTVRDMFHPRARFDRPLGEWDVARAGDFADLFGPQEKAAPVAKGESLTEDNPCPALPP